MARQSRRQEIVDAALTHFVQHGYEGTSVGAIADEVGVTKAAVSYHFPSKDDLLAAVAGPLLEELDQLLPADLPSPAWPHGVRQLLDDYLDVLLGHHDLAVWLGGDRAVMVNHGAGRRLRQNHRRMRDALVGGALTTRSQVAASIALGALWRPVRNVLVEDVVQHRDLIIESALAPLRLVRSTSGPDGPVESPISLGSPQR